jgi:glutathione-regulated potassium-efflux system protein KefB
MPEVFTATALLIVLGSAWLMQIAGLSAGLGAFLAGVLLADSEFRHELESQIQPFEGLLLGLFFMAVGMSIDLQQVLAEPFAVVGGALALMAVKFALVFALGLKPGALDRRAALLLAGVLALGGEFAFVVFGEADRAGLLDTGMRDRLVAIVGVSMALTPLLLIGLTAALAGGSARKPKSDRAYDEIPDGHPEVLIAGFGRVGQIVARLLQSQRIPFVAIDSDAEEVDFFRRFGNTVYYGDPAKPELLRAAGAARIRVFVIAVDNVDSSLRIVRLIRRNYPQAKVYARARDRRHAWKLMDLGAVAIRETFGSSLEMGREVLVSLGVEPDIAEDRARRFRAHDERILAAQHLVYDDEEALLQSARDARRELEQLFEADRGEGVLGQASGTRAE